MNIKLTLTLDEGTAEKAEKLAKEQGLNLSVLVESYLQKLVRNETPESNKPSDITSTLKGSFKAPADFDYKSALANELEEKYYSNEKNPD